jgi:hypothetical protein
MRSLVVFLIFCGLTPLHAQQLPTIEQELVSQFKKIDYWATFKDSAFPDINKYDSLEAANKLFRFSLLSYTSTVAPTLTWEFKELEMLGLYIRTSVDRLFRIYSWNTRMGGTAHVFDAVYQYRSDDNKVFSKTIKNGEGDAGRWYSNIYTLKTDDKTYYMGLYHAVFSSKDYYQGVKLFSIEKNTLNDDVRLIKTRTSIRNDLGFGFNFFSVVNRSERPLKLIYYEEDEKKLSVPVILQDGKVTKKFTVYQFNGEHFVIVSE